MRLLAVALATLLSVSASLVIGPPASGAGTPARVGVVKVVAASTTSLTLQWPAASGASSYRVRLAGNRRMDGATTVGSPSQRTFKVTGLTAGKTYCFQVRGASGSTLGSSSPVGCKPTTRAAGPGTGGRYSVLTYNLCSGCGYDWPSRRRKLVAKVRELDADILLLQELSRNRGFEGAVDDVYGVSIIARSRAILYKKSRFTSPREGLLDIGGAAGNTRYAVWAVLADRSSGQRLMVSSSHFASGASHVGKYDEYRAENTRKLLAGTRSVNKGGLPTVHGGDFNTSRGYASDSPSAIFHGSGYWDGYELAGTFVRPNNNSYNAGEAKPRVGTLWGYHLDKVWVKPTEVRVLEWRNAATIRDGRYLQPWPSDHNPILTRIVVRR